jgi:hypothetical protein
MLDHSSIPSLHAPLYLPPTPWRPAGESRSTPGSGSDTRRNLDWGQGYYVWNNDGDTATLRNSRGTTVDRCSYTSSSDPKAHC